MKKCHIYVYIVSNLTRILVWFQFLDNLIFFLDDFNYIMYQFQQLIRFIINHLFSELVDVNVSDKKSAYFCSRFYVMYWNQTHFKWMNHFSQKVGYLIQKKNFIIILFYYYFRYYYLNKENILTFIFIIDIIICLFLKNLA